MSLPTKPMTNIVRDSYPNLIINQILTAIQEGSIKPGDTLPPENELIRQFNVGRTSIREALAGLEYMEVVRPEGNGFNVNTDVKSFFNRKILYHHKIDKKRHEELIGVRQLMEPAFVIYAAQRATVNDLKHLKQLLRHMEDILSDLDKHYSEPLMEEYVNANIQFHLAIAKASQNSIYITIYERLIPMIFSTAVNIQTLDFMHFTCGLCGDLLSALEQKAGDQAAAIMEKHMIRVKEQFLKIQKGEERHV